MLRRYALAAFVLSTPVTLQMFSQEDGDKTSRHQLTPALLSRLPKMPLFATPAPISSCEHTWASIRRATGPLNPDAAFVLPGKIEPFNASAVWGYANLTLLIDALLEEGGEGVRQLAKLSVESHNESESDGWSAISLDESMLAGRGADGCYVHRFEARFWRRTTHQKEILLRTQQGFIPCWMTVPPSSFTSCIHTVNFGRCFEGSNEEDIDPLTRSPAQIKSFQKKKLKKLKKRTHNVNATLAPYVEPAHLHSTNSCLPEDITVRTVGTVCPSYNQLLQEVNRNFNTFFSAAALRGDVARDFFSVRAEGIKRTLLGDSITKKVGSDVAWWELVQAWGDRLFPRNLARLSRSANDLLSPAVPLSHTCLALGSGKAAVLYRDELEHPERVKLYNVHPFTKCAALAAENSTIVIKLGTNDFLFNQPLPTFEASMQYIIETVLNSTTNHIGGLVLGVPFIPIAGRGWEQVEGTTGSYIASSLVADSIHRVAMWARAQRRFSWVRVVDFNHALKWCAEHNTGDGVHPNSRGHLLMALEFMKAMKGGEL